MQENLKKKTKKSLPMPIIIAVICLLVVGLLFLIFGNKDNKYINYIFDANMPIPIEKNGLYGYISATDGKELIPAKYTNAKQFYGNYAVTELVEKGSTKYYVIDKKGREKISSDSRINYIAEYGLYIIDNKLYSNNLKRLTDDSMEVSYRDFGFCSYTKYNKDKTAIEGGILNSSGKKVFTYKFKDSENFFTCTISEADERLGENYAKVNVDNQKYAIVNLKNGKKICDFTENSIIVEENNIFKILSNTEKKIICVVKDKIVYETTDSVDISYYDIDKKIIQIYDSNKDYSNKYSYYDISKKSFLQSKPERENYESLSSLTGYTSFTVNDKHGVMKGEKIILPCEYDDIEFLSPTVFKFIKSTNNQELVFAKSNGTYSVINLKNKKSVFDFKAPLIDTYSTSTFVKAKLSDSNETVVYNMNSKKSMTFDSESSIDVYANYIIVTKGQTKTYYNTKFKKIYTVSNND